MSTNASLISLMMSRLAGRQATATRALLVQELNVKIEQLDSGPQKPWFLEDMLTGTLVAAQNYIDLPANFLEEYEEGALRIGDMDGIWSDPDPKKVPLEVLERETDGVDAAIPEGYAIYGSKIYLGPTPDQAYPFKLKCYLRSGVIVDNADEATNPWLLNFFNYVSLATHRVMALTHLQSAEMAAKIQPELQLAYDHFWRAVESRKAVNTDPLLGDTEN